MSSHRNLIGLVVLAPLALGLGCQAMNTPLYFTPPAPILEAQGNEDPPVSNGFSLRFRNPTDKEREILRTQTDALNYGGDVPWVSRDKVHLELSYLVKNLSDQPGTFTVMVDGSSEFARYDSKEVAAAMAAEANEPATMFPLIKSRPQMLAPGASASGLFREDDFAEGELDLDALGRWMDTDTFLGVLINRSDVNPVGLALVPPRLVVPAFVEFIVNLQTDVHMTCDYVVRVRDDDDRLLHETGDTQFQIQPVNFAPPATM